MADTEQGGWLRNEIGAAVVVFKDEATQPTRWDSGFLVDADGRLVVVGKA